MDGILGFGWTDRDNSAALLKTLTSADRPDWGIVQPADFTVISAPPYALLCAQLTDDKHGWYLCLDFGSL